MLKKKLSGILAVVMAVSALSTVGFAQTEETKLFSDNFENGLSSEMWNIVSDSGLGEVKSDQIRYLKTSDTEEAEFSYEYSALKEDVSFDAVINAAEWKSEGEAFEVYARYTDDSNYFKLTYTPSSGTFTLYKCVNGEETSIATAVKELSANKDYGISLQVKHGIVRFELDGITLIQDYTGIVNFDKNAEFNYAKFKTLSQELKITSLNISEENILLHQELANSDIVMTDSSDTAGNTMVLPTSRTVGAESLLISGKATLRMKQNDWEFENKGDDFEATELTVVMKSNELNGSENVHLRTTINSDGKQVNLVQLKRDGFSIGDNYGNSGIAGKKEAVGENGKYKTYGWRAFDHRFGTNDYRTYKVRTEPNTDKSNVTVTFTAEDEEWGKWIDTQPIEPASGKLRAGGFEISTTVDDSKMYLKSYTLRDINATDDVLYAETFNDVSNWTGGAEITVEGESDNKYYITTAKDNGTLVVSDKNWKNILAETDVKFDLLPESATIDNYAGVMARYYDANNYIMGAYSPYASAENKGTVFVKSVVNGTEKIVAKKEVAAFEQGTNYKLGINVKDGSAIIFVDGDAVLNAPFDAASSQLYGSISIKSNNLATKFDNVSVSGTPYYFVEEFNEVPDWSNYKVGTKVSTVNDKVTFNADGTINAPNGSEIYLYADETSTAAWDDVEMTVKMQTSGADLTGIYFRGGVDDGNANYCIENGTTSNLIANAKWGTVMARSQSTATVPQNTMTEVKLRLTDEKTADGKNAVRVRYTVNGTEYINYLDDGSVTKDVTGDNPTQQSFLDQYPLTAPSHGRGFRISVTNQRTNIIDSITITDPEAGTLIASVSAPEKFSANSSVETKLTVDNKEYEAVETMFITALYDSNDELIDVKVSYPKTASDTKEIYTETINTGSAAKLKVFAWDGWDTMIPVAEKTISTVTIQQEE